MEEYKSILKLIDDTLTENTKLIEWYRKEVSTYGEEITKLRLKNDELQGENDLLLEQLDSANKEIARLEKNDTN
jgi:uncharacterized coiled-coil DUF342 family protein